MEIRDPVHGSIQIFDQEIPIIEHPFFQRLRKIRQLGLSEYAFPGATHTRFLHSIGTMHLSSRMWDRILEKNNRIKSDGEILRLKETLRMAALLHDVGHAPLSHSTEVAMPTVQKLQLPARYLHHPIERQATHEDYTLKIVSDSDFTSSFKKMEGQYGVTASAVADLIAGKISDSHYFTVQGINFFPLLSRLISSEMDCDRLDYLLRDSYFCGVSYGHYDLDWIVDNLEMAIEENTAYLAITERAVATFDDFLLSRYHMFLMVYFHYKSVCLEQMLIKYFNTSNSEYLLPEKIESYMNHDDAHLMNVLKKSSNPWAQKIIQHQIPTKIFESFSMDVQNIQDKLLAYLDKEKIDYIYCSSKSRLSKYYHPEKTAEAFPLKVIQTLLGSGKKNVKNIDDMTNLFNKYSSVHEVVRIHCAVEDLEPSRRNHIYSINSDF